MNAILDLQLLELESMEEVAATWSTISHDHCGGGSNLN